MGFLDCIFGKQRKLENEFFGTMLFFENKRNSQESYFECRRYFSPSGKLIEIGIDAEATGPTQKQINFFNSIEANYSKITKAATPLKENEFRNWKQGFAIHDFQKEFEPVYLQLARCESKPVLWEISFESDHDKNHIFTVTMSDFEATEIFIDG